MTFKYISFPLKQIYRNKIFNLKFEENDRCLEGIFVLNKVK